MLWKALVQWHGGVVHRAVQWQWHGYAQALGIACVGRPGARPWVGLGHGWWQGLGMALDRALGGSCQASGRAWPRPLGGS